MTIKFYSVVNDLIREEEVESDSYEYVSHNEKQVTIKWAYSTETFPRSFQETRAEVLYRLKVIEFETRSRISLLEKSETFEEYSKNYNNSPKEENDN